MTRMGKTDSMDAANTMWAADTMEGMNAIDAMGTITAMDEQVRYMMEAKDPHCTMDAMAAMD